MEKAGTKVIRLDKPPEPPIYLYGTPYMVVNCLLNVFESIRLHISDKSARSQVLREKGLLLG